MACFMVNLIESRYIYCFFIPVDDRVGEGAVRVVVQGAPDLDYCIAWRNWKVDILRCLRSFFPAGPIIVVLLVFDIKRGAFQIIGVSAADLSDIAASEKGVRKDILLPYLPEISVRIEDSAVVGFETIVYAKTVVLVEILY